MKFYRCAHCGNLVMVIDDGKVPMMCCGEKMAELIPGAVDAAVEKHVPVCTVKDNVITVAVGAVAHPMTPEHWIDWIALETSQGCQLKKLTPDMAPAAVFALAEGEQVVAAYAHCNLHGLWKA